MRMRRVTCNCGLLSSVISGKDMDVTVKSSKAQTALKRQENSKRQKAIKGTWLTVAIQ